MTTATKLREIENGRQAEYQLNPSITFTDLGMSMEVSHLISSHSVLTGMWGHETRLFPSDGNGSIISYTDLYYMPGHVDHDVAVRNFLDENTHEQTPNHTHQQSTHLGTQKPGEKEMTTPIQEIIDRLRELDRVASPAPWEAWGCGENMQTSIEHPMGDVLERGERGHGHMREDITWLREADADLITETRNALPILLEEIERLTAENTQLLETAAEVWAEGYLDKESEASEAMIERGLRKRAQNPYKKDN